MAGLSLAAAAAGLLYVGLGAVGLARGTPRSGVMLGFGLLVAVVGIAVWWVVTRLRDNR
jgi:hypothetical protein